MRVRVKAAIVAAVGIVLPQLLLAQGFGDQVKGMHGVLDSLRNEMINDPMLTGMMSIARGIAGFGALVYIANRVWRHLASAEPIDFYPLLRPFGIGLAIAFFPAVLAMTDGVLQPTVTATEAMVKGSDKAIENLLKQKENAVKQSSAWQMYVGINNRGDREKWLKYTKGVADSDPTPGESIFEGIGNDVKFAFAKASYNFRNSIKEWMSQVLQVLYMAAALCINTLRTFNLVILALLGPLAFGIAVFDGFQQSLTAWFSRYINIFLWLPVANIFAAIIGKVQEKMISLDITMINQTGDTFFSSSDAGYLIFMIIGIVGYFTVPTVAGYIVNTGGAGAMVQKITSLTSSSASMVSSGAIGTAKHAGSGAYNIANAGRYFNEGKNSSDNGTGRHEGEGMSGAIGRSVGRHLGSRLSGGDKKDKE